MENPYQRIKEQTESNQATLLVTKLPDQQQGKVTEWERTMYTESALKNVSYERYRKILQEGKPAYLTGQSNKIEGQNIFAEPFYPKERLLVFGGGHIALPLVEIASRVGFLVTVVDDRPSFANPDRFQAAEKVICENFTNCFEQLQITRNDYLVIITRGHRHDVDCLRQILKGPETIYVGMIGSKRRVATVFQTMAEEGFSQRRIDQVCAPIGLAIGAATPEEISISIISELIKRKRLDRSEAFSINRSDFDSELLDTLASTQKRACLVTILDSTGSVPRKAGAKMLVQEDGRIEGSIGGGCSEAAIMRTALELIGTSSWKIEKIDMTQEAAEEEGMVCGGQMLVLLEDFSVQKSELTNREG